MRKIFNKIICFTAVSVATLGIFSASACSNQNKGKLPDYVSSNNEAVSNGGFAVEKDDYVYFINGKEVNTADNTFGNVVKGAVMRISKDNLSNRNYSEVDTVVPQIAYSGNYNAGLFIYGDYVYYATPSTDKNSDGEVQNSVLAFKRTKLDGTDTTKNYFVQYPDNSIQYRYVADEEGKVYLMYVATNENLYGTSCTNLHSYNVETGENTLLAYNVDSVMFDSTDVTNTRVYYTMKVTDFVLGTTSSNYNQIWTVEADDTTPNEYDFSDIEDYDAEENPLYVNCGTLVFDGIGKVEGMTESVTQFNSKEEGAGSVDRSAYKYTLSNYQNDTLFYTRTSTENDTAMLFTAKQDDILKSDWKPVAGNPSYTDCLIRDSSSASSYTYLFNDGELDEVLILDSTGIIKSKVENGKLLTSKDNNGTFDKSFNMTDDGQATLLFLDEQSHYIYYSLSGGNGYTVNRLCYDGSYGNYNGLPVETVVNDYTPIRILDLDAASDWYKPELIEGQLLFPTQTNNMTEYVYVMACDLRKDKASAEVMNNPDVDKLLNERYEGISEKIGEVDETVYENLQNALRYALYTNDADYIDTLNKAYADILDYDEEHFWSKQSVAKYKEFVAASESGEWSEYSDTVKVNGKDVAANKLDFYYSLLGKMNEADAEAYDTLLKTTYLQGWPEKEGTWFENLSTGAKVGFIIGVVAGGLIVIAAAVIITLVIIKKRKKKMPVYNKKRIKVDTTDDKNIDVYSDEERAPDSSDN